MTKRILSLILAILMLVSTFSLCTVSVSAADDTMDKLVYLIKKFPHGKFWNHVGSTKNNPDGVTSTPCSSHRNCDYYGNCGCNSYGNAIQCMGYAAKVSYEITGVDRYEYEERSTLDISKLRVGDIIRLGGHSVCVTGVNGNKISITDCNYGERCIIRWITLDAGWFTNIEYVLHCKNNNRTNTNVNFHDAYKTGSDTPVTPPDQEEPDNPDEPGGETPLTEIWQMDSEDSLNIRNGKSTSAAVIGSVPANGLFNVYEKSVDGEYLWAKIEYNGTSGYSVLNYASYVSGAYQAPGFIDLKESYEAKNGISLSWSAVSGAEKYQISLYKEDKSLVKSYSTDKIFYTITDQLAGNYFVKVSTVSTIVPSWSVSSRLASVTVTGKLEEKVIPLKKLSIRKTGVINAGATGTFSVTFEPADATNKAVSFSSSNKNVATVDSKGNVTGIAPGKTVIKCVSKENSKLVSSCELTVKPSAVKTIQTKNNTTASTVGLKWSESKGATGYTLYRYDNAKKTYVKLAEGKGNSYIDKKLKSSTVYTYVVQPFAIVDGKRINASHEAVNATTASTAVDSIRQTGSDTGRVRIQWEKKDNIYAYVLYKYNAKAKKFEKLAVTNSTVYIDSDKPTTKIYYRVVTAVKTGDGYVFSEPSAILTAITGLEKPEVTKTQSNASAIKLTWSEVPYATHYQIFRAVDGKSVHIKTVTADKLSYTDKNLKSNTRYTYYVRAARAHSESLNLYSSNTEVRIRTAS